MIDTERDAALDQLSVVCAQIIVLLRDRRDDDTWMREFAGRALIFAKIADGVLTKRLLKTRDDAKELQ